MSAWRLCALSCEFVLPDASACQMHAHCPSSWIARRLSGSHGVHLLCLSRLMEQTNSITRILHRRQEAAPPTDFGHQLRTSGAFNPPPIGTQVHPAGPLLLWGNGRPHGRPSDLATELGAKTSPELPSAPCQATRRLGHLTDPRAPLASQNAPGGSRARPAGLGVVHNRWLGFSLG